MAINAGDTSMYADQLKDRFSANNPVPQSAQKWMNKREHV